MAAESRLGERWGERSVAGTAVSEFQTPGQLADWQEMMALLLHRCMAGALPEEQTCTECDFTAPQSALPPEDYLG